MRTRFVVSTLLALVPTWIAIAAITVVARHTDRQKAVLLMEECVSGVKSGLDAFFGEAIGAASCLAAVRGVAKADWLGAGGGDLFSEFVRTKDTIQMMALVDEEGCLYEATASGCGGNPWQGGRRTEDDSLPDAEPIRVSGRDHFRALVAENVAGEPKVIVSGPFIPSGAAEKCFVASAAVASGGRAAGIVSAIQTAEELSRLCEELAAGLAGKLGEGARLFVVSDSGQLVSSLGYSDRSGRYEDSLAGAADAAPLGSLGADYATAFGEALDSGKVIDAAVHGEAHLVAAARIEGAPLALCLAVPRGAMLALSRAMLAGAASAFLLTALAMVAGAYFAVRAPLASIAEMDGAMRQIEEGSRSLAARIAVRDSGEIAAASERFNRMMDSFRGMVLDVSESAGGMQDIAKGLTDGIEGISDDISSIHSDIDSLSIAVEAQRASVAEVSATITKIVGNIESLSGQIEAQSSEVAQSSAAVRQMVSNIRSVSENASSASLSFAELKEAASGGMESIISVKDSVAKLAEQSGSLLEANSVINAIASQTSLLAMNAAIEAAHAGESGSGFSVVAEEIRKLSSNSSVQSKAIAAGLRATIAAIGSIERATATADAAFGTVAAKIGAVSELVGSLASSIDLAIAEQNAGGRHVLEALRDMESMTERIRDNAVVMNAGTETVLKEIIRLAGASQKVQIMSASIARTAEAVDGGLEEIASRSDSNSEAIDALIGIAGKFRA